MYKIIALCGKSGAGKDSLMMAIFSHLEKYLNPIISHTTRPKREKEIADKSYHFVSEDEFLTLIDENKMLETTSFNNWYYGTSIDSLSNDKINIGVFNPDGIMSLLEDNRIELEIYYINFYNTKVPNGYNVEDGGKNCSKPKTLEHRKKEIWGQAKLTESEIIELRKAYLNNESPTKIYNEKYKDRLHFNSFLNIWSGKRYGLIMPEVFKVRKRHTKLNAELVKQIREDREKNNISYENLAKNYGISKSTVADIIKKRTWKNV